MHPETLFLGMPLDKALIVIAAATVAVEAIFALVQAGAGGWFLWQMKKASDERDRVRAIQQTELDTRLAALSAAIKRTSRPAPGHDKA